MTMNNDLTIIWEYTSIRWFQDKQRIERQYNAFFQLRNEQSKNQPNTTLNSLTAPKKSNSCRLLSADKTHNIKNAKLIK